MDDCQLSIITHSEYLWAQQRRQKTNQISNDLILGYWDCETSNRISRGKRFLWHDKSDKKFEPTMLGRVQQPLAETRATVNHKTYIS